MVPATAVATEDHGATANRGETAGRKKPGPRYTFTFYWITSKRRTRVQIVHADEGAEDAQKDQMGMKCFGKSSCDC